MPAARKSSCVDEGGVSVEWSHDASRPFTFVVSKSTLPFFGALPICMVRQHDAGRVSFWAVYLGGS